MPTSRQHTSDLGSIKFWGVRGSIATPGTTTLRYGGNTPCIEIRLGGKIFIVDAGSGIRNLGLSLVKEFSNRLLDITLLITHTHWDHIQGFPFFAPAYNKGNSIHVIGKTETQSAFEGQMDGGKYFPVNFGLLASTLKFSTVNGDNFVVGDVTIKTCPTNHPGGCTAYRFEYGKCSIVVLSDHETGGADDARIAAFIHAADYLIADTQYNSAEMNLRKGWGHGCIDQVVELATRSSVKQLFLYHHDPLHDDEFMDNFLLTAKQEAQALGSLSVFAATEGNEYHITS